MKVFSKIAVIAAAFMLVSAFVSCKNDAEEGSGIVAEFVCDSLYGPSTEGTLTCYDDNTWDILTTFQDVEFTFAKGTYEGDPSKDGKIKVIVTHLADSPDSLNPISPDVKDQFTYDITITKGTFDLEYVGTFKRK